MCGCAGFESLTWGRRHRRPHLPRLLIRLHSADPVSRETSAGSAFGSGEGSGETEIGHRVDLYVRQTRLGDGRCGTPLDDHGDGDDLAARLPYGLDGGERRTAGGRGVLDHQAAAALHVGAL